MISVVIPIYNRNIHVARLVSQFSFICSLGGELIFIDDGSTDCTFQTICDQAKKSGEWIKSISKINTGPSDSRQLGLEMSSKPYVWFFDSDDTLTLYEDNLTISDVLLEMRYDVYVMPGIVYGNDGTIIRVFESVSSSSKQALNSIFNEVNWSFYISRHIFSRDYLLNNKINWPRGIFTGEDMLFLTKFYSSNPKVGEIASVRYEAIEHYDQRLTGVSSTLKKEKVISDLLFVYLVVINDNRLNIRSFFNIVNKIANVFVGVSIKDSPIGIYLKMSSTGFSVFVSIFVPLLVMLKSLKRTIKN